MTRQGWITFSAIGLLVLIFIIGLIIYFAKNSDSWPFTIFNNEDGRVANVEVKQVDEDEDAMATDSDTEEFINNATDFAFKKDESSENEYSYNPASPNSYASYQHVKIGLIIEQNEYQVNNVIEGTCGDVYLITAYMPGPAVLTNSLNALFGNTVYADFLPGNIIPTYHPNLTLQDVRIDDDIAKIYLGGTFSGSVNGSCDAELAMAQLTQTALSYPNVTAVQIYQNGDLIN